MATEAKCPFPGHASKPVVENRHWWPNTLRVDLLNQHSSKSDPLAPTFNYREEFKKLDYEALKNDLRKLMTDSQDWWPADFGNYGPQFIRMSWHSAGTYRLSDGRGGGGRGQQRFAPLNSWPDNVNIDKSRRLLWPIKQKYGQKISWADLLILTGNVALETMGFRTFGFAARPRRHLGARPGRELGHRNRLAGPPASRKIRTASRRHRDGTDLRQSGRPGHERRSRLRRRIHPRNLRPHGDERRGDRCADRRRPYLRQDPRRRARVHKGSEPEAADLEAQGLGWVSNYGTGNGKDTVGSGLEVTWTQTPAQWSNFFFENLFKYEWVQTKSPAAPSSGRPRTPRPSSPTRTIRRRSTSRRC